MERHSREAARTPRRAPNPAVTVLVASVVSATVAWRLARRTLRRERAVAIGPSAVDGRSDGGPHQGAAPPPVGVPAPEFGRPDKISTMWGNIAADGGDTEPGLWGAVLFNGSDVPIRYAHLTVRHRRDGWISKEGFHKIPPRSRFKWSAVKVYANASGGFGPSAVVRPRQERPVRIRRAWQEPTLFTLELTFQDAARRFWLLSDDDELAELGRDLVIWCDDERYITCRGHIGTEFQPKFGVDVKFERFDDAEDLQSTLNSFSAQSPRGRAAPDILVGAHDWLGKLAERGAVAEVSLAAHQRDAFEDMAIRTLVRDGRLCGVPYSFDCVAIIMNADLTGDAPVPATFEALLALGEQLRGPRGRAVALQMGPAGDVYHLWPLLSSVGATMAGLRPDGSIASRAEWEPDFFDAIAALVRLRKVAPALLDPRLTRDAARALFLEGQTPYLISACGRLGELLEHSMNVRTAPVPPLGDHPARSFVTVMTFYLSPYGENQRIAQDLLTYYLARPDTGVELNRIQPWPPVQRDVTSRVSRVRPELAGFVEAQRNGILMPSHPRMRSAWEALSAAELAIARGEQSVKTIAGRVVSVLAALNLHDWT